VVAASVRRGPILPRYEPVGLSVHHGPVPSRRPDLLTLVPEDILRFTDRPEDWYRWRDLLPGLVADVLDSWELIPDGYRAGGQTALVLGVRTAEGEPAAAKFGWPHPESEWEHVVLRLWDGAGSVRLRRADPARGVLLLERIGPADLRSVGVRTACRVVAGLYPRLHRPATPQFPLLSDQCRRWAEQLIGLPADAPAPRRLVQQAAALASDFAADAGTDGRILHTDLHYENVLAAEREPWLVIDPKPLSGDPCFEVAPLLWNRWDEAIADGSVREAVRERVQVVVDAAALDRDRVRDWVIVRELVNVLWTLQDSPALGPAEHEWITRSVTIAKAVQD
jgi:streptomycin 6-kinase